MQNRKIYKKENNKINQGIDQDNDNPEWTEEDFARARTEQEVLLEMFGQENADNLLKRRNLIK